MKKILGALMCSMVAATTIAVEIQTLVLPDGDVGLPYNAVLSATDGTPPYAWSWANPGSSPYAESTQPNSFAQTGTAQGWQADWGNWYLGLPFSFPFMGESYTYCWVRADGNISLGDSEGQINVFNTDLDTSSGDIYIDSTASTITIRWEGNYWGQPSEIVSFSVTLTETGEIVMKYGSGNVLGGEILLSSSIYRHDSPFSWNSMSHVQDLVFVPVPSAPVVDGLSMSTNRVVSGTPPEPYDGDVVILVSDGNGDSSSTWFNLMIHDDRDADGMQDQWERIIVADNPVDGIATIEDVLRDDNYDGDGFSNIEEFLLGFDPLVPDGNVPDTMGEGLDLIAKALTNDADMAYFSLIDACFASVLATEPTNYSARVYRAASRLLNLANDEDLRDLIEQFGGNLIGSFTMTGDFNFDTAPMIDAAVDIASANILPAIDASLADLSAIPSNWTGMVEISTNYFPIDETVYADLGDVVVAKSIFKLARSVVLTVRAQQLSVDYEKMVVPMDAPLAAIAVDGATNDWAGIPRQLVGEVDSDIEFVKGARNGSSVYFLMAFRDPEYEFMGMDADVMLGRDSEMDVECYPFWNHTNIWFSATGTNTSDMVWSYTNSLLEVGIQVPPGIEVSNACVMGIYVEFGEYVDQGGYGYWEFRDGEDLHPPFSTPIETFKGNHPEFMQAVRSVPDLELAKTNLQEAIDLFQLADGLIEARVDALMHVIEYDPAGEADRMEILARIGEGEQSLAAPVHTVATNDAGEVLIDETIHLGAFFQPAYLNRAMLPEFWNTVGQPLMDTLPDPTFGGIFPNVSPAKLVAYLSKVDADTDWDGDGIPNGWEHLYYGHPTAGIADADGDGDGHSARDEYISGTDPTQASSHLSAGFDMPNPAQMVISWQPVEDRMYDIHWSPSLGNRFQLLATGIAYPQGAYTDTVHRASSTGFYRVVARMPGKDDLDADGLPDDWEGRYFGNYSAAAVDDSDGDGQDNIGEYIAGTDPRDGSSFFTVADVRSSGSGFVVEWVSVPERAYSIMWTPGLGAMFQTLEDDLAYPANCFTDTLHNARSAGFYRVDVEVDEPSVIGETWVIDTANGLPLAPGQYFSMKFGTGGAFAYDSDAGGGTGSYLQTSDTLHMDFISGPPFFESIDAVVSGDTMSGTFRSNGFPFPFTAVRYGMP